MEVSTGIMIAMSGFAMAFLAQFGAIVYFAATLRSDVKHIGETLVSWRAEFKEEREEIIGRINRHSDDLKDLHESVAVLKSSQK
jgi:hypothetical protein